MTQSLSYLFFTFDLSQDPNPVPVPRADGSVSFWRPTLRLSVMAEEFTFTRGNLPSDVRRYMTVYVSCHLPVTRTDIVKNKQTIFYL